MNAFLQKWSREDIEILINAHSENNADMNKIYDAIPDKSGQMIDALYERHEDGLTLWSSSVAELADLIEDEELDFSNEIATAVQRVVDESAPILTSRLGEEQDNEELDSSNEIAAAV